MSSLGSSGGRDRRAGGKKDERDRKDRKKSSELNNDSQAQVYILQNGAQILPYKVR